MLMVFVDILIQLPEFVFKYYSTKALQQVFFRRRALGQGEEGQEDQSYWNWSEIGIGARVKVLPVQAQPPPLPQELSQGEGQEGIKFKTMSLEQKFDAAVRVIQSLPKDGPYQPSNSTKLKFYSLFKQATIGKCNQSKPLFLDIVGRAKWNAWTELGDMDKEEAMNTYIEELKKIVETMSFNGDVQEFLDSIGPFYEFVNLHDTELNHVKESLDQITSSSSSSLCSSQSSSLQSTPIKILGNNNGESLEVKPIQVNGNNGDNNNKYSKLNGKVKGPPSSVASWDDSCSSVVGHPSSYLPPGAPVHRASLPNGSLSSTSSSNTKGQGLNGNGTLSDEYDPSADEVLEVDEGTHEHHLLLQKQQEHQHESASAKASLETWNSGTDSDRYYSGDSEPDEFEDSSTTSNTTGSTLIGGMINGGSSTSTTSRTFAAPMSGGEHGIIVGHGQVVLDLEDVGRLESHKERQIREGGGEPGGGVVALDFGRRRASWGHGHQHLASTPVIVTDSDNIHLRTSSLPGPDLVIHSTVERLNRDVDHILARLRILETAYANNPQFFGSSDDGSSGLFPRRRRRELFPGLSMRSLALVLTWPFVAYFIIKLLKWWLGRRRRRGGPLALGGGRGME